MSHVDNVLLSFSILEDAPARMGEVNEWLSECGTNPGMFGLELADVEQAYGGYKRLEAVVYAAAFNYLPEDDFLAALKRVGWEYPDEVQILIRRQHDPLFEILTLP